MGVARRLPNRLHIGARKGLVLECAPSTAEDQTAVLAVGEARRSPKAARADLAEAGVQSSGTIDFLYSRKGLGNAMRRRIVQWFKCRPQHAISLN